MIGMEKNSQPDSQNQEQFNDNLILSSFDGLRIRYSHWVENLKSVAEVTIGTLGPKGTTSEMTSFSLIVALRQSGVNNVNTKLYENFAMVTKALFNREVDVILIPNAYDRISDIYWDPRIKIDVYFQHVTPKYGLYARHSDITTKRDTILSVMPACTSIIDHLQQTNSESKSQFVQITSSTEEAARLVAEGKADIAITNELCAKKYGLVSLASEYHVEMLWTVFSLKRGN